MHGEFDCKSRGAASSLHPFQWELLAPKSACISLFAKLSQAMQATPPGDSAERVPRGLPNIAQLSSRAHFLLSRPHLRPPPRNSLTAGRGFPSPPLGGLQVPSCRAAPPSRRRSGASGGDGDLQPRWDSISQERAGVAAGSPQVSSVRLPVAQVRWSSSQSQPLA